MSYVRVHEIRGEGGAQVIGTGGHRMPSTLVTRSFLAGEIVGPPFQKGVGKAPKVEERSRGRLSL